MGLHKKSSKGKRNPFFRQNECLTFTVKKSSPKIWVASVICKKVNNRPLGKIRSIRHFKNISAKKFSKKMAFVDSKQSICNCA
jgi:hypothetical protein